MTTSRASIALLAVLCVTRLGAEALRADPVQGRLTAAGGEPVEGALLELEGEMVGYTDLDGRFTVDVGLEAVLEVSHPLFETATIEVTSTRLPTIVLEPRRVRQEIAVTASGGDRSYAPTSVASTVVNASELAAPPATLTELVASSAGVSENGQGGIFQTYSIRGIARLRVLTLLSGMRVIGERRAGVSASFLDPGLMGDVDVLRGPSSTYYGSGALGGVIQMFPREFDSAYGELSFESNGDGSRGLFGWGDGRTNFGIAHRRSEQGETPAGEALNDGFDQTSATFQHRWERGERRYSLLAIGSRGTDIGKSNSDFPERVTDYPEENHLLVRFEARGAPGWRVEAWAHPNDLITEVRRDGELTTTANEALDLGFNFQQRRKWGSDGAVRFGFDYFGRVDVTADETIEPLADPSGGVFSQRPLDASESELGLYGAYERHVGNVFLLLGGRLAAVRQSAADARREDDSALSGFAGVVVPLGSGFEMTANLGSGMRFPSLSERYFNGVTPRGSVIGNPELEPERSRTIDAGLRYSASRFFASLAVFSNSIDDYIERVEVAADELTFVNLTSGTVEGIEFEAVYAPRTAFQFVFGGHAIEGRADDDQALADVPPDSVFADARGRHERWRWNLRWEHRFAKDDPGSGELEIDATDLLDASLGYDLPRGLTLTLAARNLLDETYFASADDKASIARARSVTLTLGWTADASLGG